MDASSLVAAMSILAASAQKRIARALVIVIVAAFTVAAIWGLAADIVTKREALLLAGLNLVLMAGYFRALDPKQNEIHPIVTSLMALLGFVVLSLTLRTVSDHPFVSLWELIAISIFLLAIPVIWLWLTVVYLGSYDEVIQGAIETLPEPVADSVETVAELLGLIDSEEEK